MSIQNPEPDRMSPDEWDKAVDECFKAFSVTTGELPDEALSREAIYTREDQW